MDDRKLLNTVTESLAGNYGIEGSLARLPGENLNFLVTDKDGTKHVFKIVDEHMPPDVVADGACRYGVCGCRRIRAPFASN